MADDYLNSTSTSGRLSVGGISTGNIEVSGDTDWFRISLVSGRIYQFDLRGSWTNDGTLYDPYMSLRNSSGTKVFELDDGGVGYNSRFTYTATYSGYYFVAAGSNNNGTGTYEVAAADVTPIQLPDLDVQNAGDSYPPTLSAYSVIAGGSVILSYRLSNWGPGSAPSSVTGIYRSIDSAISTGDTRIDTDANAALAANSGRTEMFTIDTTGWAAGNYYIGAVADYANAIAESNETNNPSSGVLLTVTTATTDNAGNTLSTATALTLGGTTSGSVGVGADTDDFFRFTATSSGRVTARLTGLSADIDLQALNSSGSATDTSEASGTATEFVSFNVVAGQTYYLHIDPYGTLSSNYSLITSFSSTTIPQVVSSFLMPFTNLTLTQEYSIAGALSNLPTYKHLGEDYGGAVGSAILAAANGKVVAAINSSPTTGFGNYVIIEHYLSDQSKIFTLYGHLSYVNAKFGDTILAGEQIGVIGATGNAAGLHLHFEISLVNGFTNTGMYGGGYDSPTEWLTSSQYTLDPSDFVNGAIFGTAASNTLTGSAVNNFLFGVDGNDVLIGGAGRDRLDGGIGTDRAQYTDSTTGLRVDLQDASTNTGIAAGDTFVSVENLHGSLYGDTLRGNSVANSIWGDAGSDVIYGQNGDDYLQGNQGRDTIYGGFGNDTVRGGQDNDVLQGNQGRDTIYGDLGDDTIRGGQDGDWLYGGDGNDSVSGDLGSDYIDGGAGIDTANFAGTRASYSVASLGSGSWTVTHIASGDMDQLLAVESLRFDDLVI